MSEDYIGDLTTDEARAKTMAMLKLVGGLDINEAMSVFASAIATCVCNSAPSPKAMHGKLVETAMVLLRAAEYLPAAATAQKAGEIRLDDLVH